MSEIEPKKTYYKLTTENLKSACTSLKSGWGVLYRLDEWVKPVQFGSKLFVFSNLLSLQEFKRMLHLQLCENDRIFECEVKEPKSMRAVSMTFQSYSKFWKERRFNQLTRYGIYGMNYAPLDTVACSAVKLTREL